MSRETPATEKQLRLAFKVSTRLWNVCKSVFEEFSEYLGIKESFMGLMVELDLQKGMIETEYKNPKMHEMRQHLYNADRYKPKGDNVNIEAPKVEITFTDARMSEEELDEAFKFVEPEELEK